MNDNHKRESVAKLTTYCERMIQRGQLPALDELNLRIFVDATCSAFEMAPVQDSFERDSQAITEVMERKI